MPRWNYERLASRNRDWADLYEAGIKMEEIAAEYGVTRGAVSDALKTLNVESRNAAHYIKKQTSHKNGYKTISAQNHPRAFGCGKQYEHILVAEKTLGRYLEDDEVVHHIDLDKHNNHPDNLEVLTQTEHVARHRQVNNLITKLFQSQQITFNKTTKLYEMTKEYPSCLLPSE